MGRHREDEGPLARRFASGRLQALLPVLLLLLVARAHDHGVITNRPDLSTSKASLQDSRVRSAHRMCPLLQALDQCRHTTLPTQAFWPTALANNPVSAFCTSGRIPGSGICWILASTPAGERIRRQDAQSQAPEYGQMHGVRTIWLMVLRRNACSAAVAIVAFTSRWVRQRL